MRHHPDDQRCEATLNAAKLPITRPGSNRMIRTANAIIAILLIISAAVNAYTVMHWDISYIANDGVQYLSTARNWLEGAGFSTDALIYGPHFQGVVPAAQTVWPPGYPFAIALVSMIGLELPQAGLTLNVITHAVAAGLLFFVLLRMDVTKRCAAIATLLFYLMAMPWSFVSGLMTEPVFTTLLIGATLALPNPRVSSIFTWLLCGVLMALAIYVRYSAVFFAAGIGAGLFLYIVLYERPTISATITMLGKLSLMMLLPVLAFAHLMYRTSILIGTLDRYSGSREPETLLSTMWLWGANSAELLGFGTGHFFDTAVGIALYSLFTALIVFLGVLYFVRNGTPDRTPDRPATSYARIVTLVSLAHGLGLVIYLTISSMSDTPLEIINRYLYQIYFGFYLVFCYLVTNRASQPADAFISKDNLRMVPLVATVTLYLFVQINELHTSRQHFFEEPMAAAEVMSLPVGSSQTLNSHIRQCVGQTPGGSIWSTHGQHVHLHTKLPTVTQLNIYTRLPFDAEPIKSKIDAYNIQAFVFVGDQQHEDQKYRHYMASLKKWLADSRFSPLTLPADQVRGNKQVTVYIDDTAC